MKEKENLIEKSINRQRFDFEDFVFHLSQYKTQFKNLNIKHTYVCADGYKLGEKVAAVRTGKVRLTKKQITKLINIDFIFTVKDFDFYKFYQHLLEYKRKFGNLKISKYYFCRGGYNLSQKVAFIRLNAIKLTDQQKDILNQLGFIWEEQTAFNFKKFYIHLLQFKQKYGHLEVPAFYVCEDGYKLGKMLRLIFSWRTIVTEQQKESLIKLGLSLKTTKFNFNKFYQHLLEYKQQFGDFNVPMLYICSDGYRLWNKIDKIHYNILTLTDQQKEKLANIGFVHSTIKFDFNRLFKHLQEYKQQFGDLNIPTKYVSNDGYNLGQYVKRIRCGYIKITEQQKLKLDEIGFIWNVLTAIKLKKFDFEFFYKKLLEYKQQFGDCLVEYDYIADNYELGLYVRNIRNHRLQLTEAQLQKLKDLDFVFNTQTYYSNRPDVPLVKRLANGDISVKNKYIQEFMPKVYKIASRYKEFANFSDLVNIGYDGLIFALDQTTALQDEEYLKRYVLKTIKWQIIKYIKSIKKVRSLSDEIANSPDFLLEDTIGDDTYRPDIEVQNRVFSRQLLTKAKEILSADEYKLLRLHFGFNKRKISYSSNQLAKKYNTTPQEIEMVLQKIIFKLKQNLSLEEWFIIN